jgi:hypothetical protein
MTTPSIEEMARKLNNKIALQIQPSNEVMQAVRAIHKELLEALTEAYQAGIDEAVERKGWKGYVAVDPKADNYKYSPVFSDRKGAELWIKGKEINGLEVVEVDILLVDHSELDQDKV